MMLVQEPKTIYGNWKLPCDFKHGQEVLIAFSKKNGHAYLIAGKYEVHGHFIFKKTFSRLFCEKSCEPLIYIRLCQITKKDIKKIETYIEETESIRESSCINYCLITIFSSLGILINSNGKNIVNLQDCLEAALLKGALRDNSYMPIEVYKTTEDSLDDIVVHFNKLEERFRWTHILSRALGRMFFFYRISHRTYYKALYKKEATHKPVIA